jgi:DNA-binding Lrp family transcriptional regulator
VDALDRAIINALQGGFEICERPYAAAAERLGMDESTLLRRLAALLDAGTLSRFGPMYHAERLGGALTLAAMAVPPAAMERVAALVNAHPEVAHNYEREHALNMWFVIATEQPEEIARVIRAIEAETGLAVYDMPKQTEFYVGLHFQI